MIFLDENGDELQEIIVIPENEVEQYTPVTHALAVVKAGEDYLMGFNHWQKDWEIFGGCIEEGETIRECIVRECREELGIEVTDFEYLGLMKCYLAPDYFSKEWRIEYGGLFGITLREGELEKILESKERDEEEIEKVSLYKSIPKGEKIAGIDEKLLEYYK